MSTIGDFYGCNYDDYCLLVCNSMKYGTNLLTFHRNPQPSSSEQKNSTFCREDDVLGSAVMSLHFYQATQCHIPEESHLLQEKYAS
jgi:hypothetical protein